MPNPPTVFVSYSWDSDAHKDWVRDLATRLRHDGVDVTLDQWHLHPGTHAPRFMEVSIQNNEFVLIVCTPMYKVKSQANTGGVAYEGSIITAEIFAKQNTRKYLPILKEGNWNETPPVWVWGRIGFDFSREFDTSYKDLLLTLRDERPKAPPLGVSNILEETIATVETSFVEIETVLGDIRISGIVYEEIEPAIDTTSKKITLYRVPFLLSARPPYEWGELFRKLWSKYKSPKTSSRVVRVLSNKLLLHVNTLEDIEQYHFETLKLVAKETNSQYAEYVKLQRKQEEELIQKQKQSKDDIKNIAKRLDFDSDN